MRCPSCEREIDLTSRAVCVAVYEDELGAINVDILCPACYEFACALVDPTDFFHHDPFKEDECDELT